MNAFWGEIAKNNRIHELIAILVLSIFGFLVAIGSVTAFFVAGHHLRFLIPGLMGLVVGIWGQFKFAFRWREAR